MQIIPPAHPIRPAPQILPAAAVVRNVPSVTRPEQQPCTSLGSNIAGNLMPSLGQSQPGLSSLRLNQGSIHARGNGIGLGGADLPSEVIVADRSAGLEKIGPKNQFLEQLSANEVDNGLDVGRRHEPCNNAPPHGQIPGRSNALPQEQRALRPGGGQESEIIHRQVSYNDPQERGVSATAILGSHMRQQARPDLPTSSAAHTNEGLEEDEGMDDDDDDDGMPSFDLLIPRPAFAAGAKLENRSSFSTAEPQPPRPPPRSSSLSAVQPPAINLALDTINCRNTGPGFPPRPEPAATLSADNQNQRKRRLADGSGSGEEDESDKDLPVPAATNGHMRQEAVLDIFSGLSQAYPTSDYLSTLMPEQKPAATQNVSSHIEVNIVRDSPDRRQPTTMPRYEDHVFTQQDRHQTQDMHGHIASRDLNGSRASVAGFMIRNFLGGQGSDEEEVEIE